MLIAGSYRPSVYAGLSDSERQLDCCMDVQFRSRVDGGGRGVVELCRALVPPSLTKKETKNEPALCLRPRFSKKTNTLDCFTFDRYSFIK